MRERDYLDLDAPSATDAHNAAVLRSLDLGKDTPARQWWFARHDHPSIARALGIDRDQCGGNFALWPFRMLKIDEVAHLCAAYPAPRTIGEHDPDWLAIETIIAWNPVSNTTQIVGDAQPQIVGCWDEYHGSTPRLFGQARTFFQEWARNRARFWGFVLADQGRSWRAAIQEPDLVPGMLAVGKAEAIRWQPHAMPAHIECLGINEKEINKQVFKALRMPRFTSGMRAAA